MPKFMEFVGRHTEELKYDMPYEKGDMPFPLDDERLANLFANNVEGTFPFSEFAVFLQEIASQES